MKTDESLYWIWLAEKCGVASREFPILADRFGSAFEIYRMEAEELESLRNISLKLRSALCDKSLEHAYAILRYCKKNQIGILTYASEQYPSRLRTLEDPPAVLYYMGRLPDFDRKLCMGVVGTRKISEYGVESAYTISYELASAGVPVISGMALGVDGVAACAAIAAGGVTVAVLGCGVDVTYPKIHATLRRAILKGGAIISEFAPGEKPLGFHFPLRNRLISGLSQGVLVVEGNKKSGAMITADRATAQGREVFALPGKINESNSDGPNELIRNGANVALCAEDIILHYDFLYHDVIDYAGLRRGKATSAPDVRTLKRYGVDYVWEKQPKETLPKQEAKETAEKRREATDEVATPREETGLEPVTDCGSAETALAGLDDVTRRVFSLLPLDRAITADAFLPAGIGIAEAVTALTVLEIEGLVVSLPGGMYTRK